MDAQELLDRFSDISEQPDGGFIALCPAHGDSNPSLRLWVDETGRARFHCRAGCATQNVLTCVGLVWRDCFDITGDIPRVAQKRSDPVGETQLAQLNRYVMECADRLPRSSEALTYFRDRFKMTGGQAARLRVGFDPGTSFVHTHRAYTSFPRLTVPLLNFHGEPHGLQGRDITGAASGPQRWVGLTNPTGLRWGLYGWVAGGADVVVTEGPSDGLTAARTGHSVLIIRGAAIAANAELQAELRSELAGRRVFVAGDPDRAGRLFASTLAKSLSTEAKVFLLGIKGGDLTDWSAECRNFSSSLETAKRNATEYLPVGKPVNRARNSRLDDFLTSLLEDA